MIPGDLAESLMKLYKINPDSLNSAQLTALIEYSRKCYDTEDPACMVCRYAEHCSSLRLRQELKGEFV